MTTVADRQRAEALARANDVRMEIARFRRRLRALSEAEARGEVIAALRVDELGALASMPVQRMLLTIPRFGRAKARRVLDQASVTHEALRVGHLTRRQREVIADTLAHPRQICPSSGLPVVAA